MDGGVTFVAILAVKLAAALGSCTGVITAVKWFNTYEFKDKKKGGTRNVSDDVDYLREKVRSKY